ncbi:oxysterol-binding protein-related protein 9 isoform X2 [Silurus asotus]|uniref:Oxysterol-binding protein n=1 Tax=Silurus asotus TaxID=30991 RepID=A0AAD5A549_SILAS|nr:oxysterol-binding protein-related protein 9 isoform X2 [Silurus asotus]
MASIMEGPLSKWTNLMKGWQYRWFVLDYNAGLLSYYTSKDKMMRGSRRGCVRLRGAVIGIDDEDDSTFTITVDQKTFHFQVALGRASWQEKGTEIQVFSFYPPPPLFSSIFTPHPSLGGPLALPMPSSIAMFRHCLLWLYSRKARDADEREKWIHALEGTILRHALQLREAETAIVPSVQDFDKKLAEADAYLQILIDQLKLFDEKIKDCKDEESRKKIENLKETTCSMVESIKHCIVLLQIAKDQSNEQQHANGVISTINPVDGVHQPSPLDASVVSAVAMPTQTTLPTDGAQVCKAEQRPSSLPMGPVVTVMGSLQTPTPNSTGSGPSAPSSSVTSPSHMNVPAHTVPDFSYSSSEDEFYDADEFYQSSASPKHCIDPSRTPAVNSEGNAALKRPDTTESLNSSMSNGTTDADQYDSHDERDDDGEGESVEEHKSVIMHLLSQVRLGMDLTKVVLPTFILERRSLLEMYADFFAHPDLFVSIAEQSEPRERMAQVVRWYLSAFHAGRKGSVAKKPYNPILGEVFYCHWDLPSDTEEPASGEPVSEGPVPYCSRGSVSFVAEQVSHHPPISAFYAECISKKIQFNAHIWTKSKFLGMSIGVHNIGQGCVSCLEHDEHYILTFPNGYGRSILTVPWVELGGECNISCSKSGYSANIVFHTKPFYGGKKHRITAEIFGPNDKKSFCSIEGEWNGVMYAKWASGENTVFIDTRKIGIIKKKVRKLEDQLEYESRCLWKDVTLNLKLKDIDAATEAKHRLEEKQRAEARERKEKEVQWETRLFHEDGECWVYDEPLLKRMASLRH